VFCAISTSIFPRTNNKDNIPTPKTNVIAIIPTESVLIFLSSCKQKARGEYAPRACKISFASATRLSQAFGTRGFPSPDYSGFGFIGNFCLLNLAYYLAILVPNQVNDLNHLIS
jgi:hypothetical protein